MSRKDGNLQAYSFFQYSFITILFYHFIPLKGIFPLFQLENFRHSVFIISFHSQMKTQMVQRFILVRVEFSSTTGTSLYTDVVK